MSEARRMAFKVSGKRSIDRKRKAEIDMAAKASIIDITPGAWRSPRHFVDDFAFVENGCDDHLLHALDNGIVYADRLGYHEPPFQEITIDVLAAVEKEFRKNGKRPRAGLPRPLLPERPAVTVRKIPRTIVKTRKITPAVEVREGPTLTAVVEEMFREEVGKPLLEVVSQMFDSLKGAT